MTKKQLQLVTFCLLLACAMSGLDGTIINTALPAIISDLHGIEYMGWLVAVFLLGMSVFTPLWSKLGEKFGNKLAFQLAVTLFIISSFLQAQATNIWFFIMARALMGIGAGGMGAIPYIILAQLYQDIQQRSRSLAYVSASFSVASIIGPLVGGILVDWFSWHWVFYINIPLGLISIGIVQFFFKEEFIKKAARFDALGSTLLIVSLLLILTAIQMSTLLSKIQVGLLFLSGMVLLGLLITVEKHAKDPILPGSIFKNKLLVFDFVVFSLIWGAQICYSIYVPMWAQGLLGTTALIGGLTQIPSSIFDFIGSQSANFLNERYKSVNLTVAIGGLAILVAILILSLASVNLTYFWLLFCGIFFGFGVGLVFNALQIKVQEDAGTKDLAVATSFSFLIRIMAQTLMSAIYGLTLNQALLSGVKQTKGQISMAMLNKLSDAATSVELPSKLLPTMRRILHQGIHNIMLLAALLLVISLLLLIWAHKKEQIKNLDKLTD